MVIIKNDKIQSKNLGQRMYDLKIKYNSNLQGNNKTVRVIGSSSYRG